MRRIWPWALGLASVVGGKTPCLYTTASAYSPGQPGWERLGATVVLPDGQEHSTNAVYAAATSVDGGFSFGTGTLEGSISGRVTECNAGEVVVDTCDPNTATQATGPSVVQLRTQDLLPETVGRDVVRVLRLRATDLERGAVISIDKLTSRVRVLPIRRGAGESGETA